MLFSSWLRNRTSKRPSDQPAASRPSARFRPRLESLDDRLVPSTLTVTTALDDYSAGSLRGEIAAAHSGDTIVFSPDLFIPGAQTIRLGNPPGGYFGGDIEIAISTDLTIQGPGAGELAVSGGGAARVFDIVPGAHVTISGLTIEGGNGTAGGFDPAPNDNFGGGILNQGTLTLSGCTVTHNSVNGYTFDGGGGIANFGTMTMSGCTVTGNTADVHGGGVYNTGTLTIIDCTITGNTAYYRKGGDDIYNLGKIYKHM